MFIVDFTLALLVSHVADKGCIHAIVEEKCNAVWDLVKGKFNFPVVDGSSVQRSTY